MSYEITTTYTGKMPNQVEGIVNGRPFYFRGRFNYFIFEVFKEKIFKDVIYCVEGDASEAGWWEDDKTIAFVKELLEDYQNGST